MMKRFGLMALAGAMLGLAMGPQAEAGGVLKVPVPDWTGGAVTCEILHSVLEGHMDFKVKRITMPSGSALDEGMRAGDLDFGCERWPTYDATKDKYVTDFGGDGSIVYYAPTGIVGQSGYYVPRYLVEGDGALAPDLKSYEQLNQYKDLFKTLESGDQGRIIGCPVAAWECEDAKRMEMLGIDFVVTELGSEVAHFAEMQAAYKRKEPFIAYAWEPHWIFAVMDLVEVKLPDYTVDGWPATDWGEDVTVWYGPKELAEKHPEIVALMQNARINNAESADMMFRIDEKGEDMEDVVAEWVANNEDRWSTWIPK
ncbi:MAG: glycine betaine ABC transporter substrate-binding protein [Pseudomonadota bacterium]